MGAAKRDDNRVTTLIGVDEATLLVPTLVAVSASNELLVSSVTDGAIIGPGEPSVDSYTQASFNLTAAANQVLVSSSANKQIWVYGIVFTFSIAGTVSFQDEDDTAITGIMTFATNSGLNTPPSGNFAMPLWKLATNKDFEVDLVTAEMDGSVSYAIISV